jgi:hypothetical protein
MREKYDQRCAGSYRSNHASKENAIAPSWSKTASAAMSCPGVTLRASQTASGTSCGGGVSARHTLYCAERRTARPLSGRLRS